MKARASVAALGALILGSPLQAQDSSSAAPLLGPPIRRIATAIAVSQQTFGALNEVQELSGNRVLVNDGQRRQLLLLDTTLAVIRAVLDSVSESENTYGNRAGVLIPYRADSSLFIDPASLALLIIDPDGNVVRVRSVPRVEDMQYYASRMSGFGQPATDAHGRLVYRMTARPARPARRPPRGVPYIPPQPDSAFVVAIDLDTRKIDTLGSFRIPKSEYIVRMTPNGGFDVNTAINPLPMTDEWAVLSDGSVALVRGIDYRVEYLNPDGTWASSAKLPYEWRPLSDEDKKRIVDSVRTSQARSAQTSYTTALIRWVNQYGKKVYPEGFSAPEGYRLPQGFGRDWALPPGVTFPANYIYACAAGEEPTNAERPSCIPSPVPNTNPPPAPRLREPGVISAQLLPDFMPPFTMGAVRADGDGNLWIRTIPRRPNPDGPVYDIVNRDGVLVDRLQLPTGHQIVGFGKGKVVYLSLRDAGAVKLARVRLK